MLMVLVEDQFEAAFKLTQRLIPVGQCGAGVGA